jgi:Spy/CpxP family protein refolding chaperone
VQERLNLTEDQKKQITELEGDVKSKMEKVLTPDQMNQLQQMRAGGGNRGGGQGGNRGEGGGAPEGGSPNNPPPPPPQ